MWHFDRPRNKEIIFFHFYFLNMDSSVTIYITELKFSVWILKVLLEGSVSHFFYLGPSFHFMTKNG